MANTSSRPSINILLVDDDTICLSILVKVLRRLNYQVVAFKSPLDALLTLRKRKRSFDLVLTNVHMPEMSGLEFLKIVDKEFKVPVVLMSNNNNIDIMIKGLEDGAAFYLVKPISTNYLSRLWQYAIPIDSANEGSNTLTNTTRTLPSARIPSLTTRLHSDLRIHDRQQLVSQFNNNNNTISNISNVKNSKIILNDRFKANTQLFFTNNPLKRLNPNDFEMRDGCDNKKSKLIWTTSLHNLFLEVVNKLGIENVMPKTILECMNVPGLRRENIASHLQVIQEAITSMPNGISNSWNERPLRSSFVLNEIASLRNNLRQQYLQFIAHAQGLSNEANFFEKGQSSNQVLNSSPGANFPTNDMVLTDQIKLNAIQGTQTPNQNDENFTPLSIPNAGQQGHSNGFDAVLEQISRAITNLRNPRVSNLQPTTNNNVGIHIGSNDEFVSPLISSSAINFNNSASGMLDNNFIGNIRANEVNYGMNNVHNHDLFQNNNNAPVLDHTFGLDSIHHNVTYQGNTFGISSTVLSGMHNIGDELSQFGVNIQFDPDTVANESGFGFYDVEGDDLGSLRKILDQGMTVSDEITFQCYFAQDEFNKKDEID